MNEVRKLSFLRSELKRRGPRPRLIKRLHKMTLFRSPKIEPVPAPKFQFEKCGCLSCRVSLKLGLLLARDMEAFFLYGKWPEEVKTRRVEHHEESI